MSVYKINELLKPPGSTVFTIPKFINPEKFVCVFPAYLEGFGECSQIMIDGWVPAGGVPYVKGNAEQIANEIAAAKQGLKANPLPPGAQPA